MCLGFPAVLLGLSGAEGGAGGTSLSCGEGVLGTGGICCSSSGSSTRGGRGLFIWRSLPLFMVVRHFGAHMVFANLCDEVAFDYRYEQHVQSKIPTMIGAGMLGDALILLSPLVCGLFFLPFRFAGEHTEWIGVFLFLYL